MGCGKSSVGKSLSALLGCPFSDLDAAIVERIGCTIPEYFARYGETAFRTLESDVLSDVLAATLSRHTLTGHSLPGHTPSSLIPGNEGICRSTAGHTPSPLTPGNEGICRSTAGHTLSPLTPGNEGICRSTAGHAPSPLTPGNEGICRSGRGGVSGGTAPAISAVLALGGGTVMTPDCAHMIQERTCCIYLRATVDTLVQRLRNEAAGRPMLRTRTPDPGTEPCPTPADADIALRERISSLLAQRSAIYESVAHHIIDVDGLSVEDVARSILSTI